jgi:Translation machinery associated TMA7
MSREGGKLKPMKKPKAAEKIFDEQELEFKKKQMEEKKAIAAAAKSITKKK